MNVKLHVALDNDDTVNSEFNVTKGQGLMMSQVVNQLGLLGKGSHAPSDLSAVGEALVGLAAEYGVTAEFAVKGWNPATTPGTVVGTGESHTTDTPIPPQPGTDEVPATPVDVPTPKADSRKSGRR